MLIGIIAALLDVGGSVMTVALLRRQSFGFYVGIGQGALKPFRMSGNFFLSLQNMNSYLGHVSIT